MRVEGPVRASVVEEDDAEATDRAARAVHRARVHRHDRRAPRRDHVDALVRATAGPRVTERVDERVRTVHGAGLDPSGAGDRRWRARVAAGRVAAGVVSGPGRRSLLGGELILQLLDTGGERRELLLDRILLGTEVGERLGLAGDGVGELILLPRELLRFDAHPRREVGVTLGDRRGELQPVRRRRSPTSEVRSARACGFPPEMNSDAARWFNSSLDRREVGSQRVDAGPAAAAASFDRASAASASCQSWFTRSSSARALSSCCSAGRARSRCRRSPASATAAPTRAHAKRRLRDDRERIVDSYRSG